MAYREKVVRATIVSSLPVELRGSDPIINFASKACGVNKAEDLILVTRPSVDYVLGDPEDWPDGVAPPCEGRDLFNERELIESKVYASWSWGSKHCVLVAETPYGRGDPRLRGCVDLLKHEQERVRQWRPLFNFHTGCLMPYGEVLPTGVIEDDLRVRR